MSPLLIFPLTSLRALLNGFSQIFLQRHPGCGALVLLALATGAILRWTRWGTHVFAIGSNEKAAVLTGINVRGPSEEIARIRQARAAGAVPMPAFLAASPNR